MTRPGLGISDALRIMTGLLVMISILAYCGGAAASSPTVTAITPAYGAKDAAVSVVIEGTDFTTGATVRLVKDTDPLHMGSIVDDGKGSKLAKPTSVVVDGKFAYVTSYGRNALEVIDITDPKNPVHAGSLTDGTSAGGQGLARLSKPTDVVLQDGYAYVASEGDHALEVVDISDPHHPKDAGSVKDGESPDDGRDWDPYLGDPSAVTVDEGIACVISTKSDTIQVIDIWDPHKPNSNWYYKSESFETEYPRDVFFSDGKQVFMACDNSLLIFATYAGTFWYGLDLIGRIKDGDSSSYGKATLKKPMSVFVKGKYAYVACYDSDAIEIIDISNLEKPKHAGKLFHGTSGPGGHGKARLNNPRGIFVQGDYAYVVSVESDVLEVVDISDPHHPKDAGSIKDGTDGARLKDPRSVFVRGDYAYVASYGSDALEVIDISPITKRNSINGTGVNVTSSGRIQCSFDLQSANPLEKYNVVVTNPDGSAGVLKKGFTIVSPPAPAISDLMPANGASDSQITIAIDGANFTGGATVHLTPVDADPVHAGGIADKEGGAKLYYANDAFVQGNYAYVVSSQGDSLEVVDISDPNNPKHVGSISDKESGEGGHGKARLNNPLGIFVQGNYAYIASAESDALEIVDISDPQNPKDAGSIKDGSRGSGGLSPARLDQPACVFVSGRYAYVGSRFSRALQIIDISDPHNPKTAGSLGNDETGVGGHGKARLYSPTEIFVQGDYAYITSTEIEANLQVGVLEIVDISDPQNPKDAGSIRDMNIHQGGDNATRLSGAHGVFVRGNYAYLTSIDDDALEIVDVSNPHQPVHVGSLINKESGRGGHGKARLDNPVSVFVVGNYAYVASAKSNALEVVDISDPHNPKDAGSIKDGTDSARLYSPNGVFVKDHYAYVTWEKGLEIVKIGTIDGTDVDVKSSGSILCAVDLTDTSPGKYNLVVTNPDGQIGMLAGGFTVLRSKCDWTSNSPVCNGTPVVFDGPSGMDYYYWRFGDGGSSFEEDPVHLYSAPGTYQITLKMKSGQNFIGCSGSVVVMSQAECTPTPPVPNGLADQLAPPKVTASTQGETDPGQESSPAKKVRIYPG
jgi:hypothetical protein